MQPYGYLLWPMRLDRIQGTSAGRLKMSQDVTRCHMMSHDVTSCHSMPLSSQGFSSFKSFYSMSATMSLMSCQLIPRHVIFMGVSLDRFAHAAPDTEHQNISKHLRKHIKTYQNYQMLTSDPIRSHQIP